MSSKLDELIAGRKTSYWANRGFVTLNIMLLLPQLSSYATGYDGSMMNGLQSVSGTSSTSAQLTNSRSLDTWQSYFGTPTGSLLGFFNCVQPVGQIASFPVEAWFSDRFGRKIGMLVGACIILSGY